MSLLDQPHHDGSPLYVGTETPLLGDMVSVRVRTHPSDPVEEIWIRTTKDAEPTFHPCTIVERNESAIWWEGEVPVLNPECHYRFLLRRRDTHDWLTGAGVFDHDVPDAFDFRLTTHEPGPDWGRDGVVYQVFPDRFARSKAADERPTPDWAVPEPWDAPVVFDGTDSRTWLQLFGGDLDGLTDHLDHVATVGADIVYTTPVFPAESNHRYNASTFDEVDPLLGGDAAYTRLIDASHKRGWKVLGDLTTNHTGDTHEWFLRARSTGPEKDWFFFHDDGTYETWMGHDSLPKLDHSQPALRSAFTEGGDSVVAHWLDFGLDGWRIDVANMTGRLGATDLNHGVARTVRATATDRRDDALVIGEHNHDASVDLPGDGWHGSMNYAGFSWPVWEWLVSPTTAARPFGMPVPIPRRSGTQVVNSIRQWHGRLGFRNLQWSWNILGSHDSARIRTITGSGAQQRVAAGLQFALPGVPMVFAGDEIGLEGTMGEDSRRTMPWDRRDTWDEETLDQYAALAALRREHTALRRGGLRWVHADEDTLAFLREHPDGNVLVVARRAAGPELRLPLAQLFTESSAQVDASATGPRTRLGAAARVDSNELVIPASDGPAFSLHA
ncbi:glycoside hydrolase family 13 protein [Nocardioides cavernaquae]|uniref:Glycoside hydrolase family 13 protein n=1 Tax=Nocardioides cavernaquae TaxID=2321396 RepID=A0A3A5HA85_9ACTN|nr:glycoside hydrolase family 13 protein [Nocardioides cavernaquae]RJS46305.1 glycoside hydrolase family 13 protein [Nocardioides cavernaquae]